MQLARVLAAALLLALLVPPALADEILEPIPEPIAKAPVIEEATSTPPVVESVHAEPEPELPVVEEPEDIGEYLPGEVIVKFKEHRLDLSEEPETAEAVVESAGLEVGEAIAPANLMVVETEGNTIAAAELLEENPLVEYAEPNYLYTVDAISSNDTNKALLWALENTGQTVNSTTGTVDSDIDGNEAFALSTGSSTLVAVIDNGVDYEHGDLAGNMWDGTSCVSELGQALGGCIHGYNFASSTNNDPANDPMPDHYHGTHVAGTIAALMNNATGTIGVAPGATLMALRTDLGGASSTVLSTSAIVKAILFADQNGADVINASFGGYSASVAMQDAIAGFDGIVIAAAGNDEEDIDALPFYPAAYDLPNIISVGASDQDDDPASFSNYGETNVDLHAPGVNILSTEPNDSYRYLSGTSMAAPHVSGVAAAMLSYVPGLSTADLKEGILMGADTVSALTSLSATGKRLNGYNALGCVRPGATSTLNVALNLVNDNGRTGTTTDFSFTLVGSTTQSFELDLTNTFVMDPCVEYEVTGASAANYTLSSADCDGFLFADETATCTLTYDDTVISSGGGGGGGGGGGSKKKKVEKEEEPEDEEEEDPEPTPIPTVVSTTAQTFTTALAQGATGPQVSELQSLLQAKGYLSVAPTGFFGPMTVAALIKYQTANGLTPTGVLDEATRAKLNTEAPASTGVSAQIAKLESLLQLLLTQLAALKASGR